MISTKFSTSTKNAIARDYQHHWTIDEMTGNITNPYHPNLQYQLIVGLEIHAQLNSRTKLFSSSYHSNHHEKNSSRENHRNITASTTTTTTSTVIPNHYQDQYVNLYDIGIPGILPVLSSTECIQKAILAAAIFSCDIQSISRFERKHYTYPDLPFGYQITQQRWPIAKRGIIRYELLDDTNDSKKKKNKKNSKITDMGPTLSGEDPPCSLNACRINRIQLEQDTGKTMTIVGPTITNTNSDQNFRVDSAMIDYNRAGIGLIEIVTEPDLRSIQQTISCIHMIRHVLKHCQICLGKMELGQFRIDANVNIIQSQPNLHDDEEQHGSRDNIQLSSSVTNKTARVEIKNLNSIQQIKNSIAFEALRHAKMLSSRNNNITNENPFRMKEETRTWNVLMNRTELIRQKDDAEDYRFMPDPDLPPIVLWNDEDVKNENDISSVNDNVLSYRRVLFSGCTSVNEFIQQYLPELPQQTIQRLMKQYQLTEYQAKLIVSDPAAIEMMDESMRVFQVLYQKYHHQQERQKIDPDNIDKLKENDADANSLLFYVGAKTVANLLTNELLALVKHHVMNELKLDEQDVSMTYSSVSSQQLATISCMLVIEESLTKTMAKQLLAILYNDQPQQVTVMRKELDPYQVAAEHNLQLVTDVDQITSTCLQILQKHPEEVKVYQQGQRYSQNILKVFMGKVMIAFHNNVHPQRLQEILKQLLDSYDS
jgi:aspartyl-tRNA(Asn)/glutamyl-tRNA(Gln) amidotransferase subunit B